VGIGTTVPLTALDITGSASLSANLSLRGAGIAHTFNILDNGTLNIQRSPGGDAGLAANSVLFLANNGYVGIGTTVPGSLLTLANNGWFSGIATASGVTNMFKLNTADQIQVGASLNIDGGITFPTDGGNLVMADLPLGASSQGTKNSYTFKIGSDNILTVYGENSATAGTLQNGRVGIGITAPLTALDVVGSASLSANLSFRGAATNLYYLDNSNLNIQRSPKGDGGAISVMYHGNNGNVGIGTTTPLFKLGVQSSQAATAAAQIYNTSTDAGADGLVLKLGNASTTVVASTNHFLSFETAGIGIVGSVQGNAGAGVTYATSGIADFAEYFKKDQNQNIPFGSVVCFDNNGLAVPCNNDSNKIIGVASEHPAFLGGENLGDKSIAVGFVGQVRTRVSAANGAIKIGDPLTTSGASGVAVRATSVGQILGKAIEAYDGQGEGAILVSVNISWYNPSIYVSYDGTLAGVATTVQSIGDQLALQALQGDALQTQLASQGQALQAQVASISASLDSAMQAKIASDATAADYILAVDPLFKDVRDKTADLQVRLDILSQKVEQQASISAFLTEIQNGQVLGASTSAEIIDSLGDIEINNATVAQDLMVLGRSTVTDLGVTGNINAGLLSIHGLDPSVNSGQGGATIGTIAGDLYLQHDGVGGVDILAGKVVIDTEGNIKVEGTITAENVEAKNYTVLGDQSIGSATIPAGAASIEISTTVASESSKIFLTSTSLTDKQITVVKKSDGKFKVAIPLPAATTPISFDWWIVGNR
jgi:hypothetical protein